MSLTKSIRCRLKKYIRIETQVDIKRSEHQTQTDRKHFLISFCVHNLHNNKLTNFAKRKWQTIINVEIHITNKKVWQGYYLKFKNIFRQP